ncbi:SRPBCC family protein [Paenibacillus sp. MMO-58]|uniref:SRPBCC family protein n=1 Tax=Paenibacillus sp. MMO-58 TaxID=3081290 RepID=UPI003015BE5B
MLAAIAKEGTGYTVTFERRLNHSKEDVWSYFTDNEKLPKWFSELRVEDLREGGHLSFNMGDGSYETMAITAYEPQAVLAFTWGEDMAVRFEFRGEDGGCRLVLIESIYKPSEHTPKDLAGWHVCLDVIVSLLDSGQPLADRKAHWQHWYAKYAEALQQLQ